MKKFELLSCRYHEKDAPPILPLTSDFSTSPLRGFVDAEDESEAASSLMGPGPWSIQAMLQLPKSCSLMHFTNKHKRSNIGIAHILKIVFRVERGDDQFVDAKTGRRKHFDIVVQTPLHILSVRVSLFIIAILLVLIRVFSAGVVQNGRPYPVIHALS